MAEGYGPKSLFAELAELPPFCKRSVLARSILGREIPQIEIGSGEKTIVYVGAHHGSESITAAVLVDFLKEATRVLREAETTSRKEFLSLLQRRRIIVIPMLNPDGVSFSVNGVEKEMPLYARVVAMNGGSTDFSEWKANARGVDLNHNYNAGFSEYRGLEHAHGIFGGAPWGYSGVAPESEPETKALAELLRSQRCLAGVLTLHAQGEEIICGEQAGEMAHKEALARLLCRTTGYRRVIPSGTAAYGGLTDWCLEALRVPAFTIECGKGKNPLPMKDRGAIFERIEKALFAFPGWV